MRTHLDIKHDPMETLRQALTCFTDECLLWPHYVSDSGYGIVNKGRKIRAHVWVCEQVHGPRPSNNHFVAHACGVKLCFNPKHLRWATRSENEADKLNHGTSNHGERNGQAKLTEESIRAIRMRWAAGEKQVTLAEEFGISQPNVSSIVSGRTWRWVK